ncbi:sarcoplasmic calcium-binding protein-like [Dreissena polymorpha]|uniref:sarcoplasmic calcium-binding protein-like n=1 Tax=Dreissena polymorpha TaxID=45954 RepID=UPI002264B33B|nr:sarcoplasmic calcium-binding protein-like [Dreissena polymorpha]
MADQGMLEEKWRIVFSLIDINKDGVVSSADAEFCKRTFGEMFADADKKAVAVADLDRYWDTLIFLGKTPDWSIEINGDKFVENFAEAFTADKTGTQTSISKALNHLLAAADIDGTKLTACRKLECEMVIACYIDL